MNSQIIVKLKKEFARNKAKSAVLGVLCLVAAYYWLPIFAKFLPNRTETANQSEAKNTSPQLPNPTTNVSNANVMTGPTVIEVDLDWSRIAQAIDSDVYMTSAPPNPSRRSPFALLLEEPEIDQSPTTDVVPTEDTTDGPEERDTPKATADFVVTSVIVGSRRSVATIDGKSYNLGDFVRTSDAEFRIIAIDAESISVTNGGHETRIPVSKPWSRPAGGSPTFR